jgi:sortase A
MEKMIMTLVVYLLLAGGGLLVCDGMWLRLKAVLAQQLLHNAWEETVRTGLYVKPWPWADSWPVARLRVGRLGIDHIVMEGDSGEVLAFGPGRLAAGAEPGAPGNCILAGHRDTSFTFLRKLQPGDTVSIQAVNGRSYDFTVTSAHVREKRGLYLEQSDSPWLTLITCYPFDGLQPGTDQRYVVFARLQGHVDS